MSGPRAILAKHPIPWQYTVVGNRVIVFDAAGMEVPLFGMVEYLVQLTHEEAAKNTAKSEKSG